MTQVAIVTGASKGLGLELARSLHHRGWSLVIDARHADALAAVVGELGDRVVGLAGDVADPAHRHDLAAAAERFGGASLLVNNASTLGPTPLPRLEDASIEALAEIHAVNALAPLALVQALLPHLRARGGAVINVTSDAAVEGYEGWGGYGSAKAALEQLSRVLAEEEPDVRVWWVDPGDLRTEMHQAAFPAEDISDRPLPSTAVPAFLRLLDEQPPSGRYRAGDLLPVAAGEAVR